MSSKHESRSGLRSRSLRGRGDSVTITGPFSLAQHVTDMIILLDRPGIDAIHVCGMFTVKN